MCAMSASSLEQPVPGPTRELIESAFFSFSAHVLSADVFEQRLEFVYFIAVFRFYPEQNSAAAHACVVNLCAMLRHSGADQQSDQSAGRTSGACAGKCRGNRSRYD